MGFMAWITLIILQKRIYFLNSILAFRNVRRRLACRTSRWLVSVPWGTPFPCWGCQSWPQPVLCPSSTKLSSHVADPLSTTSTGKNVQVATNGKKKPVTIWDGMKGKTIHDCISNLTHFRSSENHCFWPIYELACICPILNSFGNSMITVLFLW